MTAPADLDATKRSGPWLGLGLGSAWSGPTCKVLKLNIHVLHNFLCRPILTYIAKAGRGGSSSTDCREACLILHSEGPKACGSRCAGYRDRRCRDCTGYLALLPRWVRSRSPRRVSGLVTASRVLVVVIAAAATWVFTVFPARVCEYYVLLHTNTATVSNYVWFFCRRARCLLLYQGRYRRYTSCSFLTESIDEIHNLTADVFFL